MDIEIVYFKINKRESVGIVINKDHNTYLVRDISRCGNLSELCINLHKSNIIQKTHCIGINKKISYFYQKYQNILNKEFIFYFNDKNLNINSLCVGLIIDENHLYSTIREIGKSGSLKELIQLPNDLIYHNINEIKHK